MTPGQVVFVGDAGIDTTVCLAHLPAPDEKVLADALFEAPGGVVTNAAVAAARAGAHVTLFTAAGDDLAGTSLAQHLSSAGVDAHVEVSAKSTCRAVVLLDGSGEKRLILSPDAAMYPAAESVAGIALHTAAWVHTAAYDRRACAVLVERCREHAVRASIDLEPATMPGGLGDLEHLVALCHTVFVNQRAKELIGADAVARLLRLGVAEVVETRGPRGVRLHTARDTVTIAAPQLDSPVVDTTGAGDALAGWYAARRAHGDTAVDALRLATAAASLSVRGLGAIASYPNFDDVLTATRHMSDMQIGTSN